MTAHEDNPWSKAFRDKHNIGKRRKAEVARRQQEEFERKKEKSEHLQQEEQNRQKLKEESKNQIELKEVEEIKSVLKDDFTKPYKAINFLKLLNNLQYLHSTSGTQSIEYIDILSINDQANMNELADNLKMQISGQLPKIPGNVSAFIIMIDDEYATMVVRNTTEGMEVKFNDSRGVAMHPILAQTMIDILGTKFIDFQTRIEGPSSLIAIQNLLEFISSPNIVILIPESLEPEQNKLLRVLHVLYSCDLIQDLILETDKFLNIFYTAHKMQDVITIEASTRAILNYFSTFEDIKVSDITLTIRMPSNSLSFTNFENLF